jgi:hypothetical protein
MSVYLARFSTHAWLPELAQVRSAVMSSALSRGLSLVALFACMRPCLAFTHYEEDSCQIIGDPDVYGIGVRLSYYIATVSMIIAVAAGNPSAGNDVLKGLNIINFAILKIVIRNILEGSFALLEWLIVFPLIAVPYGPSALALRFTAMAVFGSYALGFGLFGVLSVWVVWMKTYQGLKEGCDPQYFIFTGFSLYNEHFIVFLKAWAIFICVFGAMVIVAGLALVGMKTWKSSEEMQVEDDKRDKERLERIERRGDTGWRLKLDKAGGPVIAAVPAILVVSVTEMILVKNQIDLSEGALDSTSQLIPLLVAIFTFISTIYSLFKD